MLKALSLEAPWKTTRDLIEFDRTMNKASLNIRKEARRYERIVYTFKIFLPRSTKVGGLEHVKVTVHCSCSKRQYAHSFQSLVAGTNCKCLKLTDSIFKEFRARTNCHFDHIQPGEQHKYPSPSSG